MPQRTRTVHSDVQSQAGTAEASMDEPGTTDRVQTENEVYRR